MISPGSRGSRGKLSRTRFGLPGKSIENKLKSATARLKTLLNTASSNKKQKLAKELITSMDKNIETIKNNNEVKKGYQKIAQELNTLVENGIILNQLNDEEDKAKLQTVSDTLDPSSPSNDEAGPAAGPAHDEMSLYQLNFESANADVDKWVSDTLNKFKPTEDPGKGDTTARI